MFEAEEVLGSPYLKPTSSPSLAALLPLAPGGGVWERCRWLAGLPGWAGWDQHQLRQVRALVSGPAGLSCPVWDLPAPKSILPSSSLASRAMGPPSSVPRSASLDPSGPL